MERLREVSFPLRPVLYPPSLFEVVDQSGQDEWVTTFGDGGERYSYAAELNEAGFFEDYFDGKQTAIQSFRRYMQKLVRRI